MSYLEGAYGVGASSSGGGGSGVTSVTSSGGTITVTGTTTTNVDFALNHANIWTGVQTLENPLIADSTDNTKQIAFLLSGSTTGTILTISSSQTGTHSLAIPILA